MGKGDKKYIYIPKRREVGSLPLFARTKWNGRKFTQFLGCQCFILKHIRKERNPTKGEEKKNNNQLKRNELDATLYIHTYTKQAIVFFFFFS
jgi:hypothetical protein